MWWFFSGGVITAIGIIAMEKPFHILALKSVGLLDTLLDPNEGEEKLQKLQTKIFQAVSILVVFIILCFVVLVPTWLLTEVTAQPNLLDISSPVESHWGIYFIGSVLPFLGVKFIKKKTDYSSLSQLLHRLILNHYNLGGWMLKKQIKPIEVNAEPRALLITGLARAGTTAITKILAQSENFKSLDYSNMPFLLYPRFWSKIYKPKQKETKERAHGDGIKIGLSSVEALEEYFFKQQLNDSFITTEGLVPHTPGKEVIENYKKYQKSIAGDSIYLAKNNNNMLRLEAILNNPMQQVVIMYRDPVQHAFSLLKQHRFFVEKQNENHFTLEYMNWLGHHEFGNGQKPFIFKPEESSKTPNDLDYWLQQWINYYEYALNFTFHERVSFVSYQTLLEDPQAILKHLSLELDCNLNNIATPKFHKTNAETPAVEPRLLNEAQQLFETLNNIKIKPLN